MKTLHPNWFFEDLLDPEYKKYILLAYLQDVKSQFNQTKLYPQLADLVGHYRNLSRFVEQKNNIYNAFPERMTEMDLRNFRIAYNKVISNDELMETLVEIVSYSLPQIRERLREGREIYEFIEKEIILQPVGILPLYRGEGYMIVRSGDRPELKVFEYEIKLFETEDEKYRAISTTYIDSYRRSFVNTTENIKIDMIRKRKKLPNPATFSVETHDAYPLEETLLQIAKRMLMKYLDERV